MNFDGDNEMFRLAVELVNQSSRNIFLTGKAGTGKTTFLKYLRENCPKQMAIVAPTGVAAINAGGVTMHSFFQLPMAPYIPDAGGFNENNNEIANRSSLLSRLRMTNEKKRIIRELELLVFDEISMVRCDMLDAIDTVLRHIRRKPYEKFGGLQVVFIGDMFQLPPVIKEPEWRLLKEYYNSPYFFDSFVIKEERPLYIEFNKIYRQSDKQFISLLNQVRNNELDDGGRRVLDSRYQPVFRRTKQDGFIILTTHNEKARATNSNELNNLGAELFTYEAVVEGDFPESAFPAEGILQLKVGAQVMFIKNDTERTKRYFNGKIGVITELDNEKIFVRCIDDPNAVELRRETWENIRYSMNNSTRQLENEVLGSFTQYPLRLAWAITIHKSQGLTFEKAIIDAGEAFAPGQVYVALSRCTTLDGIILKSKITSNGLFIDDRIVQFSRKNSSAKLLEQELQQSRKSYQLKILVSLFDYKALIAEIDDLKNYLDEHASSFNDEASTWTNGLLDSMKRLQTTAERFQKQLINLFQQEEQPGVSNLLQERIKAGARYFINEQNEISEIVQRSPVITDSRNHAKEVNDGLKEFFAQISLKRYQLDGISEKFEMEIYHRRKKQFILPVFTINAYAGTVKQKPESPHSLLYQRLRKLRDAICIKKNVPIYIVAGSNTLDEMARYLPQTLTEIRKISGFGDAKTEQYGQQFLDIILEYCKENNLSSLIHEKIPKRERKDRIGEKQPKIDTKVESFELYKEGKAVREIANERGLTIQTIEGHLAHYVQIGEIKIDELVSKEKIVLIEPIVRKFAGNNITAIKEKLGNNVSYGEIKMVIAWLERHKDSPAHEDH